jgi:2-C-methyl-D-erythritol 2,4-cyclodiphosphate synthase
MIKPSKVTVGGVELACYYSIQAHSDGDVLLHAIVDACLGALALGDIGQWFPDTKEENAGRKSSEFLSQVMVQVKKLGFRVANIDTNVFLEEPKLAPHSDAIRQNIAKLLGVELSQVSLKAKTMEGLGPVGERRAISASAIVLLEEIH